MEFSVTQTSNGCIQCQSEESRDEPEWRCRPRVAPAVYTKNKCILPSTTPLITRDVVLTKKV